VLQLKKTHQLMKNSLRRRKTHMVNKMLDD